MSVGEFHEHVLDVDRLAEGLVLARIGSDVRVLPETPSTNNAAFQAASAGAPDGTVIFTEHQPQGRGRLGRPWISPRSASVLSSTLLIEGAGETKRSMGPGAITLAAAVAVVDAVGRAVPDVEPVIRWPNDVMIGGRKLCGILIETRPLGAAASGGGAPVPEASSADQRRAIVVGIGINCLQHRGHFAAVGLDSATSLEAESRETISRLTVARELLLALDAWLAGNVSSDALRRAWLDRAEPLGQHIHLRQAGEAYSGRTIDIDPTAGLVVELDRGGRRVFDPYRTSVMPLT